MENEGCTAAQSDNKRSTQPRNPPASGIGAKLASAPICLMPRCGAAAAADICSSAYSPFPASDRSHRVRAPAWKRPNSGRQNRRMNAPMSDRSKRRPVRVPPHRGSHYIFDQCKACISSSRPRHNRIRARRRDRPRSIACSRYRYLH